MPDKHFVRSSPRNRTTPMYSRLFSSSQIDDSSLRRMPAIFSIMTPAGRARDENLRRMVAIIFSSKAVAGRASAPMPMSRRSSSFIISFVAVV